MLRLRLRRRLPRSKKGWAKLLMISIFISILWDTFCLGWALRLPQRVSRSSYTSPGDRYFIASTHWNNEAILRSHWNRAMLDLVKQLGVENTFVAVLESGSWDDSKGALRELELELSKLNVPHWIALEGTTHLDAISQTPLAEERGWVWTSRGRKELRRIPYLASLRNRVMAAMTGPNMTYQEPFTKVLWMNDVVFTTEDVLTLLSTNSGDFATACSLDFAKPPSYYDTFALRDIDGQKCVTQTWPYFLSRSSRRSLIANEAVPVQSCWNGMVAMDASPFYAQPPLSFRGIPDTLAELHLEGSECCLVHIDNPLSSLKGVWLNPNVRVGYNREAYDTVNPLPGGFWPSRRARIQGMWSNRLSRWAGVLFRVLERAVIHWRLMKWQWTNTRVVGTKAEKGVNCLINEMQVLIENGWKHL